MLVSTTKLTAIAGTVAFVCAFAASLQANALWTETDSFAGNPGVNDLFGGVDIQGDTLFVGGREPARVEVYTNVDGTWTFDETISGLGFGSPQLDGSTAVVAEGNIVNVLEDIAGTWTQVAAILPSGHTSHTKRGSTIVVGDRNADVAYVYDDAGGNTWGLTQTLVPMTGGTAGQFGRKVYYDGVDIIAVADSREDDSSNPTEDDRTGAVHIYQKQGPTWNHVYRIPGVDPFSDFGGGLAGDGDLLVVGQPGTGPDFRGTAFVYERQPDNTYWPIQELVPASTIPGGFEYGFDVAIDGDTIVVGGQLDRSGDNNLGGAYIWENQGGMWVEVDFLQSGDIHDDDLFGVDVAISGDTTAIGALFWNRAGGPPGGLPQEPWEGKAYIFARDLGPDADYDNDGTWGLGDLNLVLFNWGEDGADLPAAWMDSRPGAGTLVGLPELNQVLFSWGDPGSVATVPEPWSCTLMTLAVLAMRSFFRVRF